MSDNVVQGLIALLGPDLVMTDERTLATRSHDSWPLRLVQATWGSTTAMPAAVVRPRTTDEVSEALAYLYRHGAPIVPFGGGSGVLGGAEPRSGSIVIDLGAMNEIVGLDEPNLTVTAGAGVRLGDLEAWLNERGYVSGHYPQSIDQAQLGGLVATRSSGQLSTRYGGIEDLLVGLEGVLVDGQVVRIDGAPRRATGPDLRHLWLGSEGNFGIITEVTLKVFPAPAERWSGAYAVASMRDGLALLRSIVQPGWRPAVLRLHDPVEAARNHPGSTEPGECLLLALSEGPEGQARLDGSTVDRLARAAGVRALGPEPVDAWLAHRNDVSAFYRYVAQGVIVDTIDVAARWSDVADLYDAVLTALADTIPELLVASAHASHCYPQGTNLYFVVAAQPPPDAASAERIYRAIWSTAMTTVLRNRGAISHHHGIGKLRAEWLADDLGSAHGLLMRLKTAFDPLGLMNPGTLLSQEPASPRKDSGRRE